MKVKECKLKVTHARKYLQKKDIWLNCDAITGYMLCVFAIVKNEMDLEVVKYFVQYT